MHRMIAFLVIISFSHFLFAEGLISGKFIKLNFNRFCDENPGDNQSTSDVPIKQRLCYSGSLSINIDRKGQAIPESTRLISTRKIQFNESSGAKFDFTKLYAGCYVFPSRMQGRVGLSYRNRCPENIDMSVYARSDSGISDHVGNIESRRRCYKLSRSNIGGRLSSAYTTARISCRSGCVYCEYTYGGSKTFEARGLGNEGDNAWFEIYNREALNYRNTKTGIFFSGPATISELSEEHYE